MTNKLLSSLRYLLYKPRHSKKRPASYRVMSPWEAQLMFANQSHRWRYRLNGGRDV